VRLTVEDTARFLAKLKKDGPLHPTLGTPCWDYLGGTFKDGYGAFRVKVGTLQYRQLRASRVAFIIFHGYDPGQLLVCHKCDRPSCCRGDHLFAGTSVDNEHDKHAKGRAPNRKGERSPVHKLTEDKVLDIRQRRVAGETLLAIARTHNVAMTTVHAIVQRRTWSHLPCSN
jgi:hypothetical protein